MRIFHPLVHPTSQKLHFNRIISMLLNIPLQCAEGKFFQEAKLTNLLTNKWGNVYVSSTVLENIYGYFDKMN